jgi:ribosome assembly protein RRB1
LRSDHFFSDEGVCFFHYLQRIFFQFSRVNNIPLAASFSETGAVHLWNLTNAIRAVDDSRVMSNYKQNAAEYSPFFTFTGHKVEGFAVHWSRAAPGQLATGDCNGGIHVWKPVNAGQWSVDQRPYKSHTSSVEDIQWSPNEINVC